MLWLKSKRKSLDWSEKLNEKVWNTCLSRGDVHLIPWGRVREEWNLDIAVQFHRSLFLAVQCLRKNDLSWLPCVHHLKYRKLLCMDLNRNHFCFSYMRHWWIKKIWESCILHFVAGSLAVFWELQRTWSWKNNPFHSLCTVYGLCRLMQIFWNEMFRRDHTTKAGMKELAFLVCSRCIVNFTVILIANISKYRLYIYISIYSVSQSLDLLLPAAPQCLIFQSLILCV